MKNLKKRSSGSRLRLLSTVAISLFILLCAVKFCGCANSSKGDAVLQSHKGYYPQGCKVCAPDGREDDFSTRTYVLSEEAYRAILLGE